MHRLALLAVGFLLVGATLALAGRPAATAQDAMSAHPVVGTWRFENDMGDFVFVSYGIFHADGTYIEEAYAGGPMNFAVWRPTGERTADLTIYNQYVIDDQVVQGEGRLAIEVDETGNAMTWTGTFVGLFPDGSIDMAIETPGGGTRLEVLPVVPLGTPVVPADMAAEGTPAP